MVEIRIEHQFIQFRREYLPMLHHYVANHIKQFRNAFPSITVEDAAAVIIENNMMECC